MMIPKVMLTGDGHPKFVASIFDCTFAVGSFWFPNEATLLRSKTFNRER